MNKIIKKTKNSAKNVFKKIAYIITIIIYVQKNYASSIMNFKGITGTTRLLNDLSAALLVISPLLAVVLTIYFSMRKGAAEAQEQTMWEKRKRTLWISCAGAFLASGIIQLIQAYYG